MSVAITTEYLLQGAAYALEQCGCLLRDANVLYKNGNYASAVVLAAFAREELGRYKILLGFWRDAVAGKKTFTIDQINDACDDHVLKQKAGMLSITLTGNNDAGIGKLLQTRIKAPQSGDAKKASDALDKIMETKTKRTPNDRHALRMRSLYVEPSSSGTGWNRPTDTSAMDAHNFLRDAVNDYSLQYNQNYTTPGEMLASLDTELYNALTAWSARPTLPAPEHPPWPESEKQTSAE